MVPVPLASQEGQSIVWVAHGTTILRCAPENLRPASLREWQQMSSLTEGEVSYRAGGASSYLDLTGTSPETVANDLERRPPSVDMPAPSNPVPSSFPAARDSGSQEDDVAQPEQELTPQVSVQGPENLDVSSAPEVERGPAAPSVSSSFNGHETPLPSEVPAPSSASLIPVLESDDGLLSEHILLASDAALGRGTEEPELLSFTTLATHEFAEGPPLAGDNLPYVDNPLDVRSSKLSACRYPLSPETLRNGPRNPRLSN